MFSVHCVEVCGHLEETGSATVIASGMTRGDLAKMLLRGKRHNVPASRVRTHHFERIIRTRKHFECFWKPTCTQLAFWL